VRYAHDLIAAATAAGVDLQSWIVEGTSHTAAIRVVREEYERRLVAFFRGALSSS
jgi:hypothetical protein